MQPGYRIAGVPWRQFNGENTMFRFTGKLLSLSAATLMVTSAISSAQSMDELVAAAKKEGQLTTIALPHSWCNYGGVFEAFKKKYPEITVNELNPDAGSGDEIEAIKANKDNKGPQAPDVIDVGLSFGPQAKADGLIQPYKVATWDTIPDSAKDAEGYWYGDYYGVLSLGVNKAVIKTAPQDWPDLLKSDYANSVALAGDPRTSNNAVMSVYASGVASGGAAGQDAGAKGLEFFKKLNDAGNFVPVDGGAASVAQGTTPIVMDWDYNLLSMRDKMAGNPEIEVVVPASAVVAGVYVQAISAYAPHPNAAKLWMEFLYSDEGQLLWLKGYCHPIRFNDLAKNGKIPQDLLDALPPAENYAKAVFPTLDEQLAAKKEISSNWDSVVGAVIK
jgi:putative spermidine/putrescine transport system substrate-binding protein